MQNCNYIWKILLVIFKYFHMLQTKILKHIDGIYFQKNWKRLNTYKQTPDHGSHHSQVFTFIFKIYCCLFKVSSLPWATSPSIMAKNGTAEAMPLKPLLFNSTTSKHHPQTKHLSAVDTLCTYSMGCCTLSAIRKISASVIESAPYLITQLISGEMVQQR